MERFQQSKVVNAREFKSSPLNWALFFGSVFFFISIMFASIAIYPGYSLAIGSTPFQAGLQNTAFGITSVILRFFLGPVMDRKGLKPLMLVGVFSFATSPLLLLISPTYPFLLASRMYQALGLAVFLPGMSALTAEMAPPGRIGTFIGATRISLNLALLAGPAGALLLIEASGYYSWFMVSSIASTISFACLFLVRTPPIRTAGGKKNGSFELIAEALKEKQVYPIIISIAIYAFAYSAVISFSTVHIEIAAPGLEAAYFFIILGLAGIASCLATGHLSDLFGRQKTAWPMMALIGLGAIAFAFLPFWPALMVFCAILFGVGIQGTSLVFVAWLIDISKPELRATTISLQENTIDIFFALGALCFGLAAQGPGLASAFLITGLVTLATILPLRRKSAALAGNKS